jgi:hypothetical protein
VGSAACLPLSKFKSLPLGEESFPISLGLRRLRNVSARWALRRFATQTAIMNATQLKIDDVARPENT